MEEEKKPTKKKSTSSTTKKTTTKKKTTTPKKSTTTIKKNTSTKTTAKKTTTTKKTTVAKNSTSTKTTNPKKSTKTTSTKTTKKPVAKKTTVKKTSTKKTTPKKVVTKEVETPIEELTPKVTTKAKVVKVTIKKTTGKRKTSKKKEPDSVINAINNINNIIDSIDDVATNLEDKNIQLTPEEPSEPPVEKAVVEEEFKSIIDNIEKAEEDFKYEGPAYEEESVSDESESDTEEPKIIFDDIEPAEDDYKYEGPVIEETNTIFDEPMEEVIIEAPEPEEEPVLEEKTVDDYLYEDSNKKTRIKLKTGSKLIIFIIVVALIGFGVYFCTLKKVPGQEIVNNSSYSNNLGVVEFKCINKKLNNVIINSNMINDMKSKDSKYTRKIKEVLVDTNSNSYLVANIKTALDLKIITENNTLTEYYYKVLGFDSLDGLINLFEETIDNIKKNQK